MKKKPEETGTERSRRIAQEVTQLGKWEQDKATQRAALSKRLGFDAENGGRRAGELRCDAIANAESSCLLYIDWTVVSIKQAQAIHKILVGGTR